MSKKFFTLSQEEIREIELDRAAGVSWDQIGEQYGVSGESIRKRYTRNKTRNVTQPVFEGVQWPQEVNWREMLDTWEMVNEQHKRFDPYLERFTIDLSHVKSDIGILSMSDLHMGGGFTAHKELRNTIEWALQTPNIYLGFSGDTIEGFIPGLSGKPAETVTQMAGSVKAQLAALESLVTELTDAGKLLWMTWGDHDAKWFEETVGYNVVKQMVHKHVPYFVGQGLIRLLLNDQEYFIAINHVGKGQSMWNPNQPQRKTYERFFPADVTISGHLHKPAFQMFHHYDDLRKAGINLGGEAWLVQNGTYKTGPDPYSIRWFSRGILGVPTIVFSAQEHDVDVFKSPAKAARYLGVVADKAA